MNFKKLTLLIPILVISIFAYNKSYPPKIANPIVTVLPKITLVADRVMLHTGGSIPALRATKETPTLLTPRASESGRTVPPAIRGLQASHLKPHELLPDLNEFAQRVVDGQVDAVRGLYAEGIMALQVVQQPQGNSSFIDRQEGTATQFQSASMYGTIGLLAHNFLAGRHFFRLQSGQELALVYGDGSIHHFNISEIDDYQRLTPTDIHSNFVELASNQTLSADQVFAKYYQRSKALVLQTCIERGGNPDWGVRFIVSKPAK